MSTTEGESAEVTAAPTGDTAQRVRDVLLATFAAETNIHDLRARAVIAAAAGRHVYFHEAHTILRSVGAVDEVATWRLSDGPPPEWEWANNGRYWLRPVGALGTKDSIVLVSLDGSWKMRAGPKAGVVRQAEGIGAALEAALMACRRAGLFGPVAVTDLEASGACASTLAPSPTTTDDPRVASLLEGIEAARLRMQARSQALPEGERGRSWPCGAENTYRDCDRAIRATFGSPSRTGKAVAEAMALPPVDVRVGPFGAEVDALNAITDLAMKSGEGEPREWLLKIVQVGVRALVASKKTSQEK